ncbi:MAG: hypothetical protein PHV04_02295 [Clostridia bacterium]|nr:hypothetical protein [Clostridia bacterium]MDD3092933.1 hypothetical protein [Clostridia bacterium]NLF36213.1 hypothetical protein [Clostridiaceae bacterium]
MKKIKVLSSFVVLVLIAVILSSCSFTTANFSNLTMSTGVDGFKPVNVTTKFTTTTPAFYVTGDINNAPDDTVISAVWYYLDTDSDYMIDQSQYQVEGTNNSFYFSLSIPDNGWPVGTYRVDLYIDDAVDQSIFFTVE